MFVGNKVIVKSPAAQSGSSDIASKAAPDRRRNRLMHKTQTGGHGETEPRQSSGFVAAAALGQVA